MLARKSVKQRFASPPSIEPLMEAFRLMCNDAIRIGLAADASSLKRLSKLSYVELRRYEGVPSYYKLCAISKAAGILAARKKSIRRGFPTKSPYLSKPFLVSCYGFKVEDASLLVPLGDRRFERVPLNAHTLAVISQPGVKVRSFTVTERSLSLCIAKEVDEIPIQSVVGIDRNLRNVTVGNAQQVIYYDVSKAVEIAENTRSIVRSFRRNDVRIRKRLAEKYVRRRQDRVRQILNRVSKNIVTEAKRNRQAIAFEDIGGIQLHRQELLRWRHLGDRAQRPNSGRRRDLQCRCDRLHQAPPPGVGCLLPRGPQAAQSRVTPHRRLRWLIDRGR